MYLIYCNIYSYIVVEKTKPDIPFSQNFKAKFLNEKITTVFAVKLLKLTDESSVNPLPKIIDELKMFR